jgi:phosphoadenylyl-sulfate reductase (thioredoxin)
MERSMQWLERVPDDGVRLPVDTPLETITAAAADAGTLVLEFGAFRNGRGFSLAAALRAGGYRGRLVAAGRLIPDQARHLARSGFDAVVLPEDADADAWRRMAAAFSAVYQPGADAEAPVWRRRAARRPPETLAAQLEAVAGEADAEGILRAALDPALGARPAVLSSFGAESAVLLALVADVAPATPVLFLDTGMHFLQTLAYRRTLTERLGLQDVRLITPAPDDLAAEDAAGALWQTDPDACCDLRKVRPLARALSGIDLVVTGRKRHQTPDRQALQPFEVFEGRVRVNPLHDWSEAQVQAAAAGRGLPPHPLADQGYRSIGCWPCTRAVAPDADARDGRWAGVDKTECGIHLGRRVAPAL